MLVYQDITGYHESIIDFNISISSAESGFLLAAGLGIGDSGLINSGIIFSGYNGYIFDQSGDFIGGYRSNNPFKISTYIHEDHVSYYIDDVLIKNNINTGIVFNKPNRIEFNKYEDSSVSIVHRGSLEDKFIYLADSSGIILISSDNIALTVYT